MKTLKVFALSIALAVVGGVALASDESSVTIKNELSKVKTAELPAKAAALVSEAAPKDRDAVAASVVRTAVKSKPAVTLAVVGAVSQKSPETAPVVAATAAELQPKRASQIAQAAASAAPQKAAEVVKAVARVLPKAHREVASAVAKIVPESSVEILAAVPSAETTTPNQPEAPTAGHNNRAPTIGGPFVPLSSTPGNVPPGGGVVPSGGRDYARP